MSSFNWIKAFGFLLSLLVLGLILISSSESSPVADKSEHQPTMKGLCWVAGDSIAQHNIAQITDIGSNWISQTPFGWMNGHESPIVVLNNDRAWWGETDRGIRHTAQLAHASGVKNMLKPHIWLRRGGDKWRSDIEMNTEEEWNQWFASYKDWIVHYAMLAEDCKIESLCIGTELYKTTSEHPDQWRGIIKEIRKVYSGKLTYAANWYKELEEITFWDDLDYIGVQAYFPLSRKDSPSKKELIKSWSKHKKSLKRISEKYQRQIVFTEIGYKNTADAARKPWVWPQDADESIVLSEETQRICYEALFESLWHEPWMDGMFIWKWFHSTHKFEDFESQFRAQDERRKVRAKERGRDYKPRAVYFTPQRTVALETLQEWYQL